jgi:CelD/BcsL family acetyltransferase involved in cellulose biosynthesis
VNRTDLRLEDAGDFEAFRGEWDELALRSRNIFATREWLDLWRRHFAPRRALRIVGCRAPAGELVAVLPLFLAGRRPLRVLRFLGRGHGDELGPVCAPEERPSAAQALRQTIAGAGCDLFLGDDLPADFDWAGPLGATVTARMASPVVRFRTRGWGDFLAGRSSNMRQQLGRFERRLAGLGLRYRLTTDADRLDEDLATLFALHRANWRRSRWFVSGRRFHSEFAAVALERGWLRLWFLELGGEPAAAWLGYRFAGVESYYQAGRDPKWDRLSVGAVLLAHSVRAALEDGMDEYRFLRGAERFKFRFATDDPGVVSIAAATTALGQAGLATRQSRRVVRAALGRLAPKLP